MNHLYLFIYNKKNEHIGQFILYENLDHYILIEKISSILIDKLSLSIMDLRSKFDSIDLVIDSDFKKNEILKSIQMVIESESIKIEPLTDIPARGSLFIEPGSPIINATDDMFIDTSNFRSQIPTIAFRLYHPQTPIFSRPISTDDISQTILGECKVSALLMGMCLHRPLSIYQMICDNGDQTVTIRLYSKRSEYKEPVYYRITKSAMYDHPSTPQARPFDIKKATILTEHAVWAHLLIKVFGIHEAFEQVVTKKTLNFKDINWREYYNGRINAFTLDQSIHGTCLYPYFPTRPDGTCTFFQMTEFKSSFSSVQDYLMYYWDASQNPTWRTQAFEQIKDTIKKSCPLILSSVLMKGAVAEQINEHDIYNRHSYSLIAASNKKIWIQNPWQQSMQKNQHEIFSISHTPFASNFMLDRETVTLQDIHAKSYGGMIEIPVDRLFEIFDTARIFSIRSLHLQSLDEIVKILQSINTIYKKNPKFSALLQRIYNSHRANYNIEIFQDLLRQIIKILSPIIRDLTHHQKKISNSNKYIAKILQKLCETLDNLIYLPNHLLFAPYAGEFWPIIEDISNACTSSRNLFQSIHAINTSSNPIKGDFYEAIRHADHNHLSLYGETPITFVLSKICYLLWERESQLKHRAYTYSSENDVITQKRISLLSRTVLPLLFERKYTVQPENTQSDNTQLEKIVKIWTHIAPNANLKNRWLFKRVECRAIDQVIYHDCVFAIALIYKNLLTCSEKNEILEKFKTFTIAGHSLHILETELERQIAYDAKVFASALNAFQKMQNIQPL